MSKKIIYRQDYLSSDGETKHWVVVYDDDSISCSCRGFSTPSKCWHVKKEAKDMGLELDISTWGAKLGPPLKDERMEMLVKGKTFVANPGPHSYVRSHLTVCYSCGKLKKDPIHWR